MGTLIFSLHYFTLFFFILLTLSASNEESHRHTTCTSSLVSCGNLQKIGYPFWGLGRPQYCGHPSLQLLCKNHLGRDYPALQIGEDKVHYLVLGIHNSSTNRTIQLQELNETCPFHSFKSFNKNFDKIFRFHFSETESVVNITLFYGCIGQMPDVPKCSIACWDNETTTYYLNTMPEAARFRSCKKVEVLVLKKQLDHLNKSNESLENVLNQGFKVDLLNFSACSMCQKSGGACGSSDDAEFACFFRKTRKLNHIVKLEISGAILVLITVNVGFWCCMKRKIYSSKLQPTRLPSVSMDFDLEIGSFYNKIPVFRYNELQEATDNFHESRKLGDGGFGSVYYGILRDGREVAAKRLYEKSSNQIDQFINEIEILTRLRHPNLVTLYGCTARNSRGLLLVYEFVPNGTVSDHLSGELKGSKTLSWDTRMKIATEIACALSYLHASDIIHRDVKTKNILLDNNFSVKVADFGLSRLFPCDVTHVSTVPQGSPGYLDPEYSKCYQLTSKSDVYSFGVVLVELISSLPAVDISRQKHEINLYDYAMNRIKDGILSELVDKKLGYESNFDVKVMINLVAELAFRCLQQEKELRPTMDEVLETLVQIGSANHKALETENKSPSIAVSKSASSTEENDMKPPLKNTQHRRSPNSVIVNYDSSKEDFKHTD